MLFRDISCDAAIARPDRPSTRNCNTSFALIFRTIDDCSFRRVALYTRRKEPKPGVAPKDATAGTQDRYCALCPPAPQTHDRWTPKARVYILIRNPKSPPYPFRQPGFQMLKTKRTRSRIPTLRALVRLCP